MHESTKLSKIKGVDRETRLRLKQLELELVQLLVELIDPCIERWYLFLHSFDAGSVVLDSLVVTIDFRAEQCFGRLMDVGLFPDSHLSDADLKLRPLVCQLGQFFVHRCELDE